MISILPKIQTLGCSGARARFAEYLDDRLTGREMQRITTHIEGCGKCAASFEAERRTVQALSLLGPVSGELKEPDNLVLRLRVAISQERAQRHRRHLERWELAWRNSFGPFLLQLSAGFASAVLLLVTVGLLLGMFARPERAVAEDEPLGMATAPRLLYHGDAATDVDKIGTINGPVVVEAYVNGSGRVYDYRIVRGPTDPQTRAQLENLLLWSVFEPARSYGQPVRGLLLMSFSGVSVRG
jgi:Putative zinc-finger